MLYLACTTISSVDFAQYGVSLAKDWVSVECGTNAFVYHRKSARSFNDLKVHVLIHLHKYNLLVWMCVVLDVWSSHS